jgi:potassium-dependent mechanosensitive channel
MKKKFLLIVLLSGIGICGLVRADDVKPAETKTEVAPAAETTEAKSEVKSGQSDVKPLPLTQVLNQAEVVVQKLNVMESDLADDADIRTVEQKLERFNRAIQSFQKESSRLLDSSVSLERIRWLENAWRFIGGRLQTYNADITEREESVEKILTDLNNLYLTWGATLEDAQSSTDTPVGIADRIQGVIHSIEAIRTRAEAEKARALTLQNRVMELNTRATGMLNATVQGRRRAISQLLEQNTSPVWNMESKDTPQTWGARIQQTWNTQLTSLQFYCRWQHARILIHSCILLGLAILMYVMRHRVRDWAVVDERLKPAVQIFERPIAIAFLLALIAGDRIYPMEPRLLTAALGIFILVPAVVILRRLLIPRLYPILNALVIFYFIDQLRFFLVSIGLLSRLLFLVETFASVLFLLYLMRTFRHADYEKVPDKMGTAVHIGSRIALTLLSVALVANIAGYGHLSSLLRNGTMRSMYAAVMLYATFEILNTFVLIAFHIPILARLGMVKRYGQLISERLSKFFKWIVILAWVIYSLDMFSIWRPFAEKVMGILMYSYQFSDQGNGYCLLDLLLIVAIIWAGFLASRFVRFVLDADVYPRLRLPHGVPYAISTLLHYLILIAVFVAAAVKLGIRMTELTILVSALGVGIGFGLQNIINNFVSGLILLFERPLKVGDSIQVGDAVGVVKQIGIRASVLVTANDSEIIVPNGTLVSERVTNWTLSGSHRIIIIPIQVSRDSDPQKVMDILRHEAERNSDMVKNPRPEVLITSLSPSLNFEVRVWTEKMSQWLKIRSDLTLALNTALSKENVKLG